MMDDRPNQVHEIIRDYAQLGAFISWLPELRPHERYMLQLQGRKKYDPTLVNADKESLKRVVTTKEDFRRKIQQMECWVGSYTTPKGVIIRDNALALYVTPNPRSLVKGAYAAIHAMLSDLQDLDDQKDPNPASTVLTALHRSRSRSCFVHLDVDFSTGDEIRDAHSAKSQHTPAECFKLACEIVGREAVTAIRTRGGLHFLIRPEQVRCETRNWHPILCRELGVDQSGDLMVPVVGCNQGGFVPHFYAPEDEQMLAQR